MSRPCTVCLHPELAELERLLTDRHSAASVAAGFGLSPDAVKRHARAHRTRRRPVAAAFQSEELLRHAVTQWPDHLLGAD